VTATCRDSTVDRMGKGYPNSRRGGDQPDSRSALPADVVRALDLMRGTPGQVDLDTLARAAGVRPRTLEAHFRRFLGTTPLGWLRRSRLARARHQLLSAKPATTVTDVACAGGFSQLGRFAGEYRRYYGELPSETLRRHRRSSEQAFDACSDEAMRLTWLALPAAFAVAPQACSRALEDLERAQELAPNYGLAKAVAGWCWGQRAAQHFGATPDKDLRRACQLAKEAEALAPDDALTVALAGGAFTLAHRLENADRLIERAWALDPSSPVVWIRRGWMSAYLGDSDGAMHELRTTLHLAPFEPFRHLIFIGIGCAHFAAERYDRALAWTRSGLEANPQSFWAERILIAAAAHYGAGAEARRTARRLMRKDPDLTVADARKAWPFRPTFMLRLCDGLEKAGLPRA
jgi:AraC-like DNA-binding protein